MLSRRGRGPAAAGRWRRYWSWCGCAARRFPFGGSDLPAREQAPYRLELHELRLAAPDLEIPAAAIPVRQHPALTMPAVHFDRVAAGAMGVAVNQAAHAVLAQRLAHRSVVH